MILSDVSAQYTVHGICTLDTRSLLGVMTLSLREDRLTNGWCTNPAQVLSDRDPDSEMDHSYDQVAAGPARPGSHRQEVQETK